MKEKEKEIRLRIESLEEEIVFLKEEVKNLKARVAELSESYPAPREAGRRYELQRLLNMVILGKKIEDRR